MNDIKAMKEMSKLFKKISTALDELIEYSEKEESGYKLTEEDKKDIEGITGRLALGFIEMQSMSNAL